MSHVIVKASSFIQWQLLFLSPAPACYLERGHGWLPSFLFNLHSQSPAPVSEAPRLGAQGERRVKGAGKLLRDGHYRKLRSHYLVALPSPASLWSTLTPYSQIPAISLLQFPRRRQIISSPVFPFLCPQAPGNQPPVSVNCASTLRSPYWIELSSSIHTQSSSPWQTLMPLCPGTGWSHTDTTPEPSTSS